MNFIFDLFEGRKKVSCDRCAMEKCCCRVGKTKKNKKRGRKCKSCYHRRCVCNKNCINCENNPCRCNEITSIYDFGHPLPQSIIVGSIEKEPNVEKENIVEKESIVEESKPVQITVSTLNVSSINSNPFEWFGNASIWGKPKVGTKVRRIRGRPSLPKGFKSKVK